MLNLRCSIKDNPMEQDNELIKQIMDEKKKDLNILFSAENTIAIYTVLRTLIKMKGVLGLEAMLEYIQKYLSMIESVNPELKCAVSKALDYIDVRKIYRNAQE